MRTAGAEVVALPGAPTADAVATVPQPDVFQLTFDDARGLALANNKKLQLGQLNVREKQIAARAATKDFFPKILGSATYLHFDDPLGSVVASKSRTLGGATIGPGGVIQVPSTTVLGKTIAADVVNQNTYFGTVMLAQPITKLIHSCRPPSKVRAGRFAGETADE